MRASSRESGDLTLGWSVPDGEPSPSPRSTPTPLPSSPSDGPESRTSATSLALSENQRGELLLTEQAHQLTTGGGKPGQGYPVVLQTPTSGQPDSHVRTCPLPESDAASASTTASIPATTPTTDPTSPGNSEPGQDSRWPSSTLWSATDLPPSSSRTYRASSPVMEARILGRSSVAWANSGMGGPTGFSTLATSECRSADGECSSSPSVLAQVLEPTAPPRFFLSARAAAGILRRASKRGRTLPTELESALRSLSDGTLEGSDKAGTSTSSARRLTPVECEMLQGWPPGWTIVSDWKGRKEA
jgi:hypothetical protein